MKKGIMILVLTAGLAQACNVPVFYYALKNWPAADYRLTVFVGQEAGEAAILDELLRSGPVNCRSDVVNVGGELTAAQQGLVHAYGRDELPRMVLETPVAEPVAPGRASDANETVVPQPRRAVWSGPFDRDTVENLLRSPAREECVRLIREGVSVVWVLLESGETLRDQAAADLLEEQSLELENSLRLPEGMEQEVRSYSDPPRIDFAVVRVSRDDPAEEGFRTQLINGRPFPAGPLVFPLFGKGRVLDPLPEAGLHAEALRRTAAWLMGPCSCTIKEQNPGRDLLFAANWCRRPDQPLFFRMPAR